MITATYDKSIFDVTDLQSAKNIILTPTPEQSTDERWEKETPYLMGLMERLNLNSSSVVLDFGAGVGRLCKALIEKYECQAIGLDISTNMRALSHVYVNNDKFFSISPENYTFFKEKVDVVIAVWTLQHVRVLPAEIERIQYMLKPDGKLFVVNERQRFIPTTAGWMDDGQDIFIALQSNFKAHTIEIMRPDIVTPDVAKKTFWGIFEKNA